MNDHQAARLAMVRRLLKSCGGRALDYGCGYGDITFRVADRFTEIVGVDISPERIQWASEEFVPVRFCVCDGDRLDFPDGAFQTVISIVVINWVQDPDRYLDEICRVLVAGGKLILAAAAPDRLRTILRSMRACPAAESDFRVEPLEGMAQRLARHGFAIEKADGFYDPLRDEARSWKGVIHAALELPMRVARVPAFAPYYGIRAVKKHV